LSSLNQSFWKEILPLLPESILHDHLINDLATENAPPSEKFFADTVEFFENHCPTTSMALHNGPPSLEFDKFTAIFIPKFTFTYEIDRLAVLKRWRIGRKWCLEEKFV